MKDKCEQHDKEITEIKTEFGQFKKDVYSKLDELFEEIKKPKKEKMQDPALKNAKESKDGKIDFSNLVIKKQGV